MVPYGYCACGCGTRTNLAPHTNARCGWVKGVPLTRLKGHATRPRDTEYRIDPETGCWLWLGPQLRGYGAAWRKGENLAHRVYYVELVGPIPKGLQLDHLCRRPLCVNPEHLEPVTNATNSRRGAKAKLNETAAAEIRASDEDALTLAGRYGVHRQTIYAVRKGQLWA